MFHDRYAFFTGTSRRMAEHFQDFATAVTARMRARCANPFVVEIGSNDGTMLKYSADEGVGCLGVEPSSNVADVARGKGLETITAFFSRQLAGEIRARSGPASAIVAAM